MKVFCPTRGLRGFSVHTLFPSDWEFTYVITDDRASHLASLAVSDERLTSDGWPDVRKVEIKDPDPLTRVAEIRTAIEHHVDLGEWYVSIDDDCNGVTMLDPVMYRCAGDQIDYEDWSARDWHGWFGHRANPAEVAELALDTVAECNRLETIYGSLSFFDNPFYRKKKFAHAAYCNSGFCVKRKDGRPWRWTPHEDMEMSCYVLRTYGACVVNRWGHGLFKDSPEGGIGTLTEDWKRWIEIRIEQLMAEYPGLLKPDGFRLKILKNSLKSVANWRRANGWD